MEIFQGCKEHVVGGGPPSHESFAVLGSLPPPKQPNPGASDAATGVTNIASPRHSSSETTLYQTADPDTLTSAIISPGLGPALNPRSCVTCRRRKVRCDKHMPCSNCRRAMVTCTFPTSGRAPRQRKPKDLNAPSKTSDRHNELLERLRRLEGIVGELSEHMGVNVGSGRQAHPDSPGIGTSARSPDRLDYSARCPSSEAGRDVSPDFHRQRHVGQQQLGQMFRGDSKGTCRYICSGFWSKMNAEFDAIRTETESLTDDDNDESDYYDFPSQALNNHYSFILGYRSAYLDLSRLHPPISHTTFLWSVFRESVDPIVKILHIPTIDILLQQARTNFSTLSPAEQALVFAIYFAAIVALESEQVQILGANKASLFTQYRFSVEQALAKANFLGTSELTVLQAFTLFLLTCRLYDNSRFCWSLTSLVVRLAQGMGLHRDGTHFDLPPFETEMRRRLWWAIIALDLRSGEEFGTEMVIPNESYDTQLPLNINDVDINKNSTRFPQPREGRSDSTIVMAKYETCAMTRRIHWESSAIASRLAERSDTSSIAEKEQMLIDVYERIQDRVFRHMDEMDPMCLVVAMIPRAIIAKACLVIYHPLLSVPPSAENQLGHDIRQKLYIAATEIIECNTELSTDSRCKQYRWLFRTYKSWHAISYVLLETCRRPWTPLTERAWHAVTKFEGDLAELATKTDHTAISLVLRRIFARVRRHRAAELTRLRADPEEARRLAESMSPEPVYFGPILGSEHKMDRARERWKLLFDPESTGPSHWLGSKRASGCSTAPTEETRQHIAPPAIAGQSMQADLIPSTDDAIHTADSFDVLMAQQCNGPIDSFRDIGVPDPAAAVNESLSSQQGSLSSAVQISNDGCGYPFFLTDSYSTAGIELDDVLAGDVEMAEYYNWQDWSQGIRGLDFGAGEAQFLGSNQF